MGFRKFTVDTLDENCIILVSMLYDTVLSHTEQIVLTHCGM